MPAKRKDQVLVNRNFLMILFALIIILMIVCAVLLGVVVSEKRSDNSGKGQIKIEDNTSAAPPSEPSTAAPQPVGIGTYKVNTTADALNMRVSANTESDILTEIPKGTLITITALNGDWGYTVYGSFSGWVNMNYLISAAPAPTVSNAVPTT